MAINNSDKYSSSLIFFPTSFSPPLLLLAWALQEIIFGGYSSFTFFRGAFLTKSLFDNLGQVIHLSNSCEHQFKDEILFLGNAVVTCRIDHVIVRIKYAIP